MKNRLLFSATLILCLCLLISSCGKQNNTLEVEKDIISETVTTAMTDTQAIEPSADTEIYTEEDRSAPVVAAANCFVDFIKEEIDFYDESGKLLLLTGQFIYPVVSIPDNSEAEKSINEYFFSEKEKYYAEAEKMHSDSLELLENYETDYWNTFIFDKKFSMKFLNSQIMSFLCHTDSYLGGAHPTPHESGLTFALYDGHCLTIDEIFNNVEAMRDIVVQIIKGEIESGDIQPFEEYESTLPSIVDEGTFYFQNNGMIFISNVYALFPYAYGIGYYTVPYDSIADYMTFEVKEGEAFSRFYSFDIDSEDVYNVLGYVDMRESSCPYDETNTCIINGEERHSCYIVPKDMGSEIIIEKILYEDGVETGAEICATFQNTGEDFCLKIVCPMSESMPIYRVTIKSNDRCASYDLIYSISAERPVKVIR